jgi:uncharacterized protein YlzI (FlbEa/FlbD family)
MIELTRYQQNKSIWINENQIESMEAQIIRDGNGDTKSNYVDIYMTSGRIHRVENTIKEINEYINTPDGWERMW